MDSCPLQERTTAYRPAGTPVLVPHDPEWATRARQHLSTIHDALTVLLDNPDAGVYEHIGSTSVPGLADA